jgi:hypothetical protein
MPILAGCDSILGDGSGIGEGSDPGDSGSGSEYVTKTYNYKVGYRPSTADDAAHDLIASLAEEILTELCYSYGAGVPTGETARMTTTGLNDDKLYYDAIRQPVVTKTFEGLGQMVLLDEIVNSSTRKDWKWSYNLSESTIMSYLTKEGTLGTNFLTTYNEVVGDCYRNISSNYTSKYVSLYKEPLTLVLYDVLLGGDYNSVKNNVSSVCTYTSQNNGEPIGFSGLNVNYRGSTDFAAALLNAKARYNTFGNYYGFTPANAAVIKEYILKCIIGENALTNNTTAGAKYETFVNGLIDSLVPTDGGATIRVEGVDYKDYSSKARMLYKDVRGFMRDTESIDSLSSINSLEYQSLVIMFDEPTDFGALKLVFESERDINIRMFMRFYDISSKTETKTVLSYSDPRYNLKNVNYFPVTAGRYDFDTNDNSIEEELAFNNYIHVPTFDNNATIKATAQQPASLQWNKVYKVYSEDTSFGTISMFDEKNATTSFVEIVFSVNKAPTDALGTDYRFKFAVDGVNIKD